MENISNRPDFEVKNAPDYVCTHIIAANKNGSAELLLDGAWCGHGEPLYRIYDVKSGDDSEFKIFPSDYQADEPLPNSVKLISKNDKSFLIYNAPKHPATCYPEVKAKAYESRELWKQIVCDCGNEYFKVSIGFEVPVDSSGPNDTTWFGLAAECTSCKRKGIVYDDETA